MYIVFILFSQYSNTSGLVCPSLAWPGRLPKPERGLQGGRNITVYINLCWSYINLILIAYCSSNPAWVGLVWHGPEGPIADLKLNAVVLDSLASPPI